MKNDDLMRGAEEITVYSYWHRLYSIRSWSQQNIDFDSYEPRKDLAELSDMTQ